MKITYKENPLTTTVELDEHEQKEFWYKIKIKEMEDRLYEGYFYLEEGKSWYSVDTARERLDPNYWLTDEKSKLDTRVDRLHSFYLEELQGIHVGDCTCVACSCCKCHAESIVGVDTLGNISKHQLYKIDQAFRQPDVTTCEQAIAYLQSRIPFVATEDWHKGYEARWTAETVQAVEYMNHYKRFLRMQKPLEADFAKILNDNLWDLYIQD